MATPDLMRVLGEIRDALVRLAPVPKPAPPSPPLPWPYVAAYACAVCGGWVPYTLMHRCPGVVGRG